MFSIVDLNIDLYRSIVCTLMYYFLWNHTPNHNLINLTQCLYLLLGFGMTILLELIRSFKLVGIKCILILVIVDASFLKIIAIHTRVALLL